LRKKNPSLTSNFDFLVRLGFFSADFFTARDRFRQTVAAKGGQLEVIPLDAKGPRGEELAIDVAMFGAAKAHRVLVHSSGLHGVEGFAGSAIQLQVLDDLPAIPKDTALILAHILNPYGMAWLRRANEHNVDLNRNFIWDGRYVGATSTYARLDSFLNPQSLPASDLFSIRAAMLILRHGVAALRQAVLGGQCDYPKGLFFGGKCLEQGPQRYESFLAKQLGSAERIVAIDVHTGLGQYAQDTLLVDDSHYETLRRMFGERVTRSDPHQGPGYRVQGGLSSLFPHLRPNAEVFFVTQEFGTYRATTMLHALREENRWHHYGNGTVDHPTKRILKDIFYPQDELWQAAVLKRGREVVNCGLAALT
jgi:hypothetical protein